MYAVTIEPIRAIYFLAERPEGEHWDSIAHRTTVQIQEDVVLDNNPEDLDELSLWRDGEATPEQVLCVSTSDPKEYKIFKYSCDIDEEAFKPIGKRFGGFYSRWQWERFLEDVPARLAMLAIPDTDPPGTIEEAIRNLRGAD